MDGNVTHAKNSRHDARSPYFAAGGHSCKRAGSGPGHIPKGSKCALPEKLAERIRANGPPTSKRENQVPTSHMGRLVQAADLAQNMQEDHPGLGHMAAMLYCVRGTRAATSTKLMAHQATIAKANSKYQLPSQGTGGPQYLRTCCASQARQ